MNPGDQVRVIAGRYRGRRAEVVETHDAPTPTGGSIRVAYVRFPRVGSAFVMEHVLVPLEEAPPPAAELRGEAFEL